MRNLLLILAMVFAALFVASPPLAAQVYLIDEDFDGISSGIPAGWDNQLGTLSANYRWASWTTGHSGACVRMNSFSGTRGMTNLLMTPAVDLTPATQLSFWYRNPTGGEYCVFYTRDDGATLTPIDTLPNIAAWTERTYQLPSLGPSVRIVFKGTSNYGNGDAYQYLDDVQVSFNPTCAWPVQMTLNALTTTTAQLFWNLSAGALPGGYTLTVTTEAGAQHFSGAIPSGQSYTLTGLAPATTYHVLLEGNCADTYNGTSGPVSYSFTTPCLPADAPYAENFDAGRMPGCLFTENASYTTSVNDGGTGGSMAMSTTSARSAYVVLPELNLRSDSVEVDFRIKAQSVSGVKPQYMVGLVTDLADVAGSFEPLYHDSLSSTAWAGVRFNTHLTLNAIRPTARVAISALNSGNNTLYIDNINIHRLPSCIRPEALRLVDYTATTATLSWAATGATTLRARIVAGSDTTYQTITGSGSGTVTGLEPNTEYSIALSGDCGAGDYSEWTATAVELRTRCTTATTPLFAEPFDSVIASTGAPECWTMGWLNRTADNTLDRPFAATSVAHSGTQGFYFARQGAGTQAYLSSRAIPVATAGAYDVTIWVRRDAASRYTGEQLEVWVNTVPDATAGGTMLGRISRHYAAAPAEPASGWYDYNFPITVTGDLYVILVGTSQNGGNLCFDDVAVVDHVSCSRATNITVSDIATTSARLAWDPSAGQTAWLVEYALLSGNDTLRASDTITTQPELLLTGLAAGTYYKINGTVRGICQAGDTAMSSAYRISFATLCGTISDFPFFMGFEDSSDGTMPYCWNGGATAIGLSSGRAPQTYRATSTASANRYDGYGSINFRDQGDGNSSWLVSPLIDFGNTGQGYTVNFYMKRDDSYASKTGEGIYLYVGDSVNYERDSLLGFAPRVISVAPAVSATGFYEFEFSVPAALAVGQKYLVFRYKNENGNGTYLDNITITAGINCARLTANVTQVDATEVVLAASDTTAAEWQAAYGPAGTAVESCSIVKATGSATLTIAGLTPLTAYDYYVRRICSAGDTSAWSRVGRFSTTAVPLELPFVCTFEDTTVNSLWTITGGSTTTLAVGSEPAAVQAGSHALYVQNNGSYTYAGNAICHLRASVLLHFEPKLYQLGLNWKSTGGEACCDYGRIMLVPATADLASITAFTNNSGYIYFGTGNNSYGSNRLSNTPGDDNGWNYVVEALDMTERAGNYYLLVLWSNDGSDRYDYPLAVDNISLSELTCNNPEVTVTGLSSTTATLRYSLQVGQSCELLVDTNAINTAAIADSTAGVYRATDATGVVTLTGLAPNTTYNYTLRVLCRGTDTAVWAVPATFATYCEAREVPYAESFEDQAAVSCWMPLGSARNTVARNTGYRHTGSASLRLNRATAIAPEVNVDSLNRYMINGWAYATTDSATLGVGLMTDPNDGSTYENFADVLIPRRNTWVEFTVYFNDLDDPDYAEMRQARNIVLAAGSDVVYVDDILVDVTPACPKPSAVSISNVGSTSFDIAFTDNASAQAWVVDCSGTRSVITSNPATISGLEPHTDYTVSVAAICSAADTSHFAYAGALTTACVAQAIPFYEGFESLAATYRPGLIEELCWNSLGAPATTGGYPRYSSVTSNNPTEGSRAMRLVSSNSQPLYLILPALTNTANAVMTFDAKYESITKSGFLVVGYMTHAADARTFVALDTIERATVQWGSYSVDFSGMPAGARMTLYYGGGPNNDYYCYLDNLEVNEQRTCSPVSSIYVDNVTATTASFGFSDGNAAHTAWEWTCLTEGGDPSAATTARTAIDTMGGTLAGLTPDADYTLYVRAVCGAGDESAWKMTKFHTACTPFAVTLNTPFFDDFETVADNEPLAGCYSGYGYTSSYNARGYTATSTANYALSGSSCIYCYTSNSAFAEPSPVDGVGFSREFSLLAGHTYEAALFARTTSTLAVVDIMLSGPNGDTTVVTEGILANCGSVSKGGVSIYTQCYSEVGDNFTVPADGVYTLLVRARLLGGKGYTYVYIDDFGVQEFTCPRLRQAPRAYDATATTAAVAVDMMNRPEAQIGWAPASATVTAADIVGTVLTTTGTATATGLAAGASYVFYYRLICSAGDTSVWSPASVELTTFASDCFEPQDIALRALGSETATVGWRRAPFTAATDYELRYGNTVVAQGSTAADTLVFAGLSSAHMYLLSLRARCSGGDTTGWSTFSFITRAGVVEAPFVCDFEDTDFNHQWTMTTDTGSNRFAIGTGANNGGSRALYVTANGTANQYAHGTAATYATMLVSLAPGDWFVSYDWRSDGQLDYDGGRFYLMPDTAADFTASYTELPAGAITLETRGALVGSAVWTTARTVVGNTGTEAQIYRLVAAWVNNQSDGNQPPLSIDNLSIYPFTCAYPARVRAHNYTAEGVSMAVTAGDAARAMQWAVTTGSQPDDSTVWTTMPAAAQDTIVLTGLNPGTNYTFFVRHICDATSFSPMISQRFITLTEGMRVLPINCGFEPQEDIAGWNTTAGTATNRYVIGNATAHAGSQSLYVTNDGSSHQYTTSGINYSYAVLPVALTETGKVDYSFSWMCVGEQNYDYARVFLAPESMNFANGTMTSGLNTIAVPAGCIALDGGSQRVSHSDWQTVSGTLNVTDPGLFKLVVSWTNDGSDGYQPPFALDNLTMAYRSCPAMTRSNVSVERVSDTQRTIRVFDYSDGATLSYEVSRNEAMTDIIAADTCSADTCTIVLDSLALSHTYYLRLTVDCGDDGRAEPFVMSFRTDCSLVADYPWSEDFEELTTRNASTLAANCWLVYNSLGTTAAVANPMRWSCVWENFGDGAYAGVAHAGSQGLVMNNGSTPQGVLAAMPPLSTAYTGLPAMAGLTGKWLSLWSLHHSAGPQSFEYGYLTNIDDALTFVSLGTEALNSVWTETRVQLTSVPDTARLAIRATGRGLSFYDDIRVFRQVDGAQYYDTVCYRGNYIANGFNVPYSQLLEGDNILTRIVVGEADTVVTAHVYRRSEISADVYDTICGGVPYTVGGWSIDNPQNHTYQSNFPTAEGCDSTVYLHLTVLPASESRADTICAGSSYVFGDTTLTTAGLYVRSYVNANGCTVTDSLLLVVEADTIRSSESICQNQLPYIWRTRSLTTAGRYTDVATSARGCSQTYVLDLAVIPADSVVNLSFCRGGQAQVADTFITAAGSYTLIRQTAEGCDLTYHITATEIDPLAEAVYDDACEGRPYSGYGIQGLTVTADTVVTITTRTADALCDSVVDVHIAYHPTETSEFTVRINEGETYEWNDNTYAVAGDYTGTFQNRFGCDSVVTLHLEVGNGVDDAYANGHIRVVPNPAGAGQAALVFVSGTGEIARVEVINSYGAVVDVWEPRSTPIDLTAPRTAGVYHARVTTADGRVYVEKLIVR